MENPGPASRHSKPSAKRAVLHRADSALVVATVRVLLEKFVAERRRGILFEPRSHTRDRNGRPGRLRLDSKLCRRAIRIAGPRAGARQNSHAPQRSTMTIVRASQNASPGRCGLPSSNAFSCVPAKIRRGIRPRSDQCIEDSAILRTTMKGIHTIETVSAGLPRASRGMS